MSVLLTASSTFAVDLFVIGFEDYTSGSLNGRPQQEIETFQWQVPKGTAEVQTNVVHSGKRAVKMGPARSMTMRRFDGGEGFQPLVSMTQYYDFWIYPDTELSDYIVVARLTDPEGPAFVDLHFADGGMIKVFVKIDGKAEIINTNKTWRARRWQRITFRFDVADQKFDLFVDGERASPDSWLLGAKFSGRLSHVIFEGPHSEYKGFSCYYDDLHWTDTDPLATK